MSAEEMDALIVRHLKDIESATSRLVEIEKNVGKVIDDVFESWSQERDWFSKREFHDAVTWIAPENWRVPDAAQAKNEFYCWFETDAINAAQGGDMDGWDNEFWLTQLCGLGVGPVGLRWICEYDKLGASKGAWKKFLELEERVSKIQKHGFHYHQKSGTFFLPFDVVDQEGLAVAIGGGNIEDALGPLHNALEVVQKAQPAFDTLIEDARKHFKTQN